MFTETKKLIQEIVDNGLAPGIDYSLILHGREQLSQTKGFRMVYPRQELLKSNQFFDLASLTKVMGTVPIIMRLNRQGKLSLDDQVHSYLPKIKDQRVKIRHLLTHTSGATAWIDHRDQLNAEELREAIYQHLKFGEDFNQKIIYNDYNYILLGFIVEKILHVPVQVAIQRDVLDPLGLKNTTFKPDPLLTVPTEVRTNIVIKGTVHDPKAASLGPHAASAGLFGTKSDVVKFTLEMLGQSNVFFDKEMLNEFLLNQTENKKLIRSLGWAFVNRAEKPGLIRHSGFTGTFILMDLITKNGLVFLSNRVHPSPNLEFLRYRQKVYETFLNEDF
ncbi:beta-lactamase family protein [Pediococcus stilesii]|uniref:Beta-lactamase family protein n=1 Tax=Pediococcus stilesii TaxID=331679 RepID=A0A5R9BX74_9LACO|nr:serine hydrolase domain-containing protein [Pediococcus stilesii]TLQ05334.1 beta-lactamase family protein [Pediococcus stilesii]